MRERHSGTRRKEEDPRYDRETPSDTVPAHRDWLASLIEDAAWHSNSLATARDGIEELIFRVKADQSIETGTPLSPEDVKTLDAMRGAIADFQEKLIAFCVALYPIFRDARRLR